MRKNTQRRRQRGLSSLLMIFVVVLTAAVASAAVLSNVGASKQARGALDRERAFQAAEAGMDWGLNRLRVLRGDLPDPASESAVLEGSGGFTVSWTAGDADGVDDDGDGDVDEADESAFAVIRSTGTVGGVSRTVQAVVETPSAHLELPGAAAYLDDASPLVDINGKAFEISGADHFIDGTLDPSRPEVWGLSSPAVEEVIEDQLRANTVTSVTGVGDTPSVGGMEVLDFDALLESARAATTVLIEPGTHTAGDFGEPTTEGVEVVRCTGDLHLSGNVSGAGILVVDGDLTITGEFTWVGIILVQGRVRLNGGGSTIRLIGTLAVDDEITDSLTVAGTVDLFYSSDAQALAQKAMAVPVVRSWFETANP